MIRRPPRSTRTDTLFPYTTLFRSGPGGAPFFTRLRLKGGMTKQLLYNTLGPIELWALSTTQEDVQIRNRSEEHTSELQSLMRISYAVFCLKKKNKETTQYK